jgi:hypothetical protein
MGGRGQRMVRLRRRVSQLEMFCFGSPIWVLSYSPPSSQQHILPEFAEVLNQFESSFYSQALIARHFLDGSHLGSGENSDVRVFCRVIRALASIYPALLPI